VNGLRSRSEALMGTIVTIATVGDHSPSVARAFEWFREVEARCSRFDPASELSHLSSTVDQPVSVSELVFEALRFAMRVAEMSGGAFDPVVGGSMIARGFNRHYLTGESTPAPSGNMSGATFRDVEIDDAARTVRLHHPLVLDLGAVAKGMAIDLAAKELEAAQNFSIDAGGDLFFGGRNDDGEEWSVGIRHPRKDHAVIEVLRVSDKAVCTSGDYERGQHLWDPTAQSPATTVASATVIAPTAMLADAVSTAACVMGPGAGIEFCKRAGVAAILFTPDLTRHEALL
jgi:thiamine biosynthesis lipoprotein